MSLLSDSVFAGGSTRLHRRPTGAGAVHGPKPLRKSKSHGGYLTPLVQLVRNPAGILGDYNVPETDVAGPEASRQQVLYLHMKDVGFPDW